MAAPPTTPISGPETDQEPLTLSIPAAARRLGISRFNMVRLVDSGEVGYVRVGETGRKVPVSELDRYISSEIERSRNRARA